MSADGVAERYASALYDLARQIGHVDRIDRELQRAAAIAQNERILVRALVAPDIPENVKHKIVDEVYGSTVSPLLHNFLRVLVDQRRFDVLSAIAQSFQGIVQDASGQVPVEVETAVDIPSDVRKQVEAEVARHTGKSPVVHWQVTPEILGGVVVRIKDNIIDYSLKSQLHQLRDRLLQAPM